MVKMMALIAYLLSQNEHQEVDKPSFQLKSPAFSEMQAIPRRYTCEGSNRSVPLYWQGVPADARSLVLVVRDPDAPKAPFYHWVLFDISPDQHRLNANLHHSASGLRSAQNSLGSEAYEGPCPPKGRHRYQFELYALDKRLDLPMGVNLKALKQAMKHHVIASTELTGLYEHQAET